jgi:modulator of FtsH protease
MAAGLTAAATAGLALYALRTKSDWTLAGGALYCGLCALLAAALLGALLRPAGLHLLISLGGALLFAAYIVFDVQARA